MSDLTRHCRSNPAALLHPTTALPHLQERLAYGSKSIQQNLDQVNFLASYRVSLTDQHLKVARIPHTSRSGSNPRNHHKDKWSTISTSDTMIYPVAQLATKACLSPSCWGLPLRLGISTLHRSQVKRVGSWGEGWFYSLQEVVTNLPGLPQAWQAHRAML
jgi:hypothetical protein